jgi:NADH:ubiquinone reductase (H+-translocating)
MEVNGDTLIDRREFAYDALILAVGSQANDFGTPGVADHCHVSGAYRNVSFGS